MIEVEFTKDFRSKKKKDVRSYYPDIAHGLVVSLKVAKYTDKDRQKKATEYIKKIEALKKERLAKEEEEKKRQDKRYAAIQADKELRKKKQNAK